MIRLIARLLSKKLNIREEEALRLIEIPPEKFGDYCFPCFSLAKRFKKSPKDIAEEIVSKIKPIPEEIEKIESAGPYINIYIKKEVLASSTINSITKKRDNYGKNDIGKGKKIMIEYGSPNTNKPLHLGHLKNDSIGMALSNILEFSGYKVTKANLLNDRGIHICKVMYAYKNLSKQKEPGKQKPDHFVGDLYVLYSKKEKQNPKLNEEIQLMLKKWEKKEKATRELWKKLTKWVEKGIMQTYKNFGSEFDVIFKESQFYNKAKDIISQGLKKKIFSKDDKGAIIAKLDPLPDKVILREDGTSVYITNDLALTRHKFEKYKIDKSVWVTGSEQKLYFEQLFRTFFLLEYEWAHKCVHIPYGMVLLIGGKMKSREGSVIDADNFIDEIIKLAREEITKREKEISKKELEKRAKAIALAAIKFYLIRIDPAKDVLFEPEKAISFEGYTGPYLQYAYARASNILNKSKVKQTKNRIDFSELKLDEEVSLIRKLAHFEEIVKSAATKYRPDLIAGYAYQIAQLFASFYEKCPVINAKNEKEKLARIELVKAVKQVLGNALSLLNISIIEKM